MERSVAEDGAVPPSSVQTNQGSLDTQILDGPTSATHEVAAGMKSAFEKGNIHEVQLQTDPAKSDVSPGSTITSGSTRGDRLKSNVDRWKIRLDPLKTTTIPPVPDVRGPSNEHNAGLFSKLMFHWLSPLLSIGYQRPLQLNDIWMVNPDRGVESFADRLLETMLARQKVTGRWNTATVTLFKVFKRDFILSGLLQLTAACLQILSPFVLRYLLLFIQDAYVAKINGSPAPPIGRGIGFVLGLTGMQIIQSMCTNHYFYSTMMMGAEAKSAVTVCIFNRAMNLSTRAKAGTSDKEGWSDGRITNLISTDVSRIETGAPMIHLCWTAPVQILLALALLLVNIGYSALAGFAFIVIMSPLLGRAVKALMSHRQEINTLTDRRVRITQEIVTSVRHIKLFGWETSFLDKLATARALEVKKIFHILTIQNMLLAASLVTPVFAAILTFVTYNLSGHSLDAARIFSSLALLNSLTTPLEYLPVALTHVVNASASLKRISEFFEAEEYQPILPGRPNDDALAVVVEQANFAWDGNSGQTSHGTSKSGRPGADVSTSPIQTTEKGVVPRTDKKDEAMSQSPIPNEKVTASVHGKEPLKTAFELQHIDFSVGRKELVVVVGSVGAGKSSLLSGLVGEMRHTQGTVSLASHPAYSPQSAWIQDASVKENILFGERFDSAWYDAVVDACALRDDFATLIAGDDTVVGEKGITLSGGQKQRINIARAVYSRRNIVLMDDPLSAVDAHVGRKIMDEAICGLLRDKCRILATHQLHTLARADKIIWMVAGQIHKMGTLKELIASDTGFQELMATELKDQDEQQDDQPKPEVVAGNPPGGDPEKSVSQSTVAGPANKAREEGRAVGGLQLEVYLDFLRATGSIFNVLIVLAVVVSSQSASIVTGLWLSWWTSDRFSLTTGTYIGIYVGIGTLQSCLMFCFAIAFSYYGTEASRVMLSNAVTTVMRAPVRFFDTTPTGQIMNRFSKDIDTLDNALPNNLRMLCWLFANILSVFALIIAYYHWFALALALLFLLFLYAAAYYRASAREIQRHGAVLRSDIFARVGEGVSGAATIRAYGAILRFQYRVSAALDSMNGVAFIGTALQRWLTLRLDAVGILVVFVVGILLVTSRFDVSPSIGGVVFSYVLGIVQLLPITVRQMTNVENDMNSVERLHQYSKSLEQEDFAGSDTIHASWPERGEIRFENVSMRYRPELPLVLKDLSIHIKAGERVGIVGRTGAGKTSIATVLLRLTELSGGSITIDNVNIRSIALETLRSRLAVIPQDPMLFQGTIRSNLDPFDRYSDSELWSALHRARWAVTAESDDKKSVDLDVTVEDEGKNFSLGQRQLLAFARVLLKDSNIVMFDEATSSIDVGTDRAIQRNMLVALSGKTVICIAHRLDTILG
jgi:ABC-type multidrug transport system fused ATPase/permease subunit